MSFRGGLANMFTSDVVKSSFIRFGAGAGAVLLPPSFNFAMASFIPFSPSKNININIIYNYNYIYSFFN